VTGISDLGIDSVQAGDPGVIDLASEGSIDPHELFEWLRSLSFFETGRLGLLPHDLAREALVSDLRWRDPDGYMQLHDRARAYYARRLQQLNGPALQAMMVDYIYLHRSNPVVRPFYERLMAQGIGVSGFTWTLPSRRICRR
jgi:hypothetical protein